MHARCQQGHELHELVVRGGKKAFDYDVGLELQSGSIGNDEAVDGVGVIERELERDPSTHGDANHVSGHRVSVHKKLVQHL